MVFQWKAVDADARGSEQQCGADQQFSMIRPALNVDWSFDGSCPQIAHESNSLNRHNDYRSHKGGVVIARIWRGWTTLEDADRYEGHLKTGLLPGVSKAAGF